MAPRASFPLIFLQRQPQSRLGNAKNGGDYGLRSISKVTYKIFRDDRASKVSSIFPLKLL